MAYRARDEELSSLQPKKSLHQAVRNQNESVVRDWLSFLEHENKPNSKHLLNSKDSEGMAPIHYAARLNNLKILQLLFYGGANPNETTTDEKLTPLHFAARYMPRYQDDAATVQEVDTATETPAAHLSTCKKVIQFLVDICKCDVNAQDIYGITPLQFAFSRQNVAAIDVLLQCSELDINLPDSYKDTPLHEACLVCDVKLLQKLLKMPNLNILAVNGENKNALHVACQRGHARVVAALLQAGFEQRSDMVNALDQANYTPLHYACTSRNKEIVSALWATNVVDETLLMKGGIAPIHIAARYGSVGAAEILIQIRDSLNILDNTGQTPLHYAAKFNQTEIIDFLIKKGADIEAVDNNSSTPLLTAAVQGCEEAFQKLLKHGATLDIVDKKGRSPVFMAARENNFEILKILASNPIGEKLCDSSDNDYNTPLHIAAKEGHFEAVDVLLQSVSIVNPRNEDGKSPLHLASESGHLEVVLKLLNQRDDITTDEDDDANTALHLACSTGHYKVAKALIKAGADVDARNAILWTPMDFGAANGWHNIVKLLIEAEANICPKDKMNLTPLHLACKHGHLQVAQHLMQNGADATLMERNGNNCLDLAIESGHRDIALHIIKSPQWKSALRNCVEGDTPLRRLIKKMPDVAVEVFNRCTTTNATEDSDITANSPNYMVNFNYEFLEDIRDPIAKNQSLFTHRSRIDVEKHGAKKGKGFSTDWGPVGFKKENHILKLMVNENSTELLTHPLVKGLLEYKWRKYGRNIYFGNLFIYILHLIFLTAFALLVPHPQDTVCREVCGGNVSNFTRPQNCGTSNVYEYWFLFVAAAIVILINVVRLIIEVIQIIKTGWKYLTEFTNWVEIPAYITSVVFVEIFHNWSTCPCVCDWQWQVGVVAVFLSWIVLILLIQKLPQTGIYVLMFYDIFKTFFRMIILTLLLVTAFALAFYMIFYVPNMIERTPFDDIGRSLLKTMTMTTGEFEFDALFHQDGDNTENIEYPTVSYIVWIIFLILMPILLTNLLVGLAVDDIKAIQEAATLKRLALQVELTLSVEAQLPTSLRRKYVIREYIVFPNRKLSIQEKLRYSFVSLWTTERYDSAEYITRHLHPNKQPITEVKLQTQQLASDLKKVQAMVEGIAETNQFLKDIVKQMAIKQGIQTELSFDATRTHI